MSWGDWMTGRAFEYGKVIGVVDLADCTDGHPSPWAEKERHNWVLQNPGASAGPSRPVAGRESGIRAG